MEATNILRMIPAHWGFEDLNFIKAKVLIICVAALQGETNTVWPAVWNNSEVSRQNTEYSINGDGNYLHGGKTENKRARNAEIITNVLAVTQGAHFLLNVRLYRI